MVDGRSLIIVALLLIAPAASADVMRCGSRLIADGDPLEKLLQHCGEPVVRQRTWITRQPRYEFGGQEIPFPGSEDVPVDLWTYDFGPDRLMRRVRLVAGKVQSIETLGYGTAR